MSCVSKMLPIIWCDDGRVYFSAFVIVWEVLTLETVTKVLIKIALLRLWFRLCHLPSMQINFERQIAVTKEPICFTSRICNIILFAESFNRNFLFHEVVKVGLLILLQNLGRYPVPEQNEIFYRIPHRQ